MQCGNCHDDVQLTHSKDSTAFTKYEGRYNTTTTTGGIALHTVFSLNLDLNMKHSPHVTAVFVSDSQHYVLHRTLEFLFSAVLQRVNKRNYY
eukprot:2165940-Amphidinium_carterae.1